MNIQLVGVIGAGVMGRGVAQDLAQTGHNAIVVDVSDDILASAQDEILRNLRFQTLFKKKESAASSADVLERISFTKDYDRLSDVDFVIENATEKFEIKKEIYAQIDRICAANCAFAANTSAISITRLASVTNRPEKILGMHFMNPVPLKSMVEVIRGYHTSAETIATAQSLLAGMGKESVVVNDSPGFVSNRVMMLTINEAIFTVHEQVATVEEVDKLFKGCFGHKMGPLETADLIGLDTILLSLAVLYESYNDSKYRPCPLLKKMVAAGLYGRKNGHGFYAYNG
jgi:3-hydroxybutyryl-CoA dehydrogenase